MGSRAKLYYTSEISPEAVLRVYRALGKKLQGKVAVRMNSGGADDKEPLSKEFWQPVILETGGTVIERGTAAECDTVAECEAAAESTSMAECNTACEETGVEIPVQRYARHLTSDIVGKDYMDYDSILVLSYFKAHPMCGFAGALEQLSLGCASAAGKRNIQTAGRCRTTEGQGVIPTDLPPQDAVLESMAEAASAVVDHFHDEIVYVNVLADMPAGCDSSDAAGEPRIKNIGILCGTDPVAIDRAAIDLVRAAEAQEQAAEEPVQAVETPVQVTEEPVQVAEAPVQAAEALVRERFMERVTSRNGEHTIDAAAEMGIGVQEYELIMVE